MQVRTVAVLTSFTLSYSRSLAKPRRLTSSAACQKGKCEMTSVNRLIEFATRIATRGRSFLILSTGTLSIVLALSARADAVCNYAFCNTVPVACQGDYCFHINQTWGYEDIECSATNCCVQGTCDYLDVYPLGSIGCAWCTQGTMSQCGYEHGCP